MRSQFNTIEQQLLRKIAKVDTFRYSTFFSNFFLENVLINIPLHQGELRTLKHSGNISFRQVMYRLVISQSLIKFLEEEKFIVKFQIDTPLGFSTWIGDNTLDVRGNVFVIDDGIKKNLHENCLKEFVVTPKLKLFVKRGFRDSEEIKNLRTFRISILSLGVAILTSLFSIYRTLMADVKTDQRLEKFEFRLKHIEEQKSISK